MQIERIKAINHHLRLALDQVGEGVAILENGPLDGWGPRVVYSNRAMGELTGRSPETLAGQPLATLTMPTAAAELLQTLGRAAAGERAEVCVPVNGAPGEHRWTISPVSDAGGAPLNYLVSIAAIPAVAASHAPAPAVPATQPVAEPEAVTATTEVNFDSQADLVEAIRDTARFVAHEFNNALTAILLPVQVAVRQVPAGSDLHSRLGVAYESARQAAGLAKDFLDCFRPRPPVKEVTNLDSLLGRAMRLATCAQNVEWSLELAPDLLPAQVDTNQIERVIFNLVRNACQAMPNGGQILVKAVNTFVQPDSGHSLKPGPYLALTVRDWGPGIPEENLPHIFNSRFTTKDNGNGCGLPICHQIVKDHGGEIHVKSRRNVGTVFMIFLPAVARDAEAAAAPPPPVVPRPPEQVAASSRAAALAPLPQQMPAAPVALSGPPQAVPVPVEQHFQQEPPAAGLTTADSASIVEEEALSLLVVDDEDGVRRALSQIAELMGFEVATAATSDEALAIYRNRLQEDRPYDSVLLDLNLRGPLNGFDVFQAIRRMDPNALVVATSGQHFEGDTERYLALGFAGFLPKPYTLEQFDSTMREVLAS